MRRVRVACVLLAITVPGLAEDAQGSTSLDRFPLWNHCAPMEPIVEMFGPSREESQRMKTNVEGIIRNRLQAARLYDDDADTYLYVQVDWARVYSSTNIKYIKARYRQLPGLFVADTWDFGTLKRDYVHYAQVADVEDDILRWISWLTDRFIVKYQRVNADTCER